VCNMSIEAGARAGMIAPDETTIEYVRNRRFAPKGEAFETAAAEWRKLASDPGAQYDKVVIIDATKLEPAVTWGTNPGMVTNISGIVPDPKSFTDPAQVESATRALDYMGLDANTPISDIKLDRVFVGACTNSRIDDLRAAARVVKGKKVHDDVYAMVVPGSAIIKKQAENEGLDKIFIEAGLDWRVAGCSMCLGM
ncbi:MAG TPA: 3-isopropylmalate dehydratase large subunit, partial [Dehalococcoidia bacterium]|nr:3-isopropylmalate dehydratase large subunit [Dehalococcoidia bacterium]